MKVNDILKENDNDEEVYDEEQMFDMILSSKFFEINKDLFDEETALFRGYRGNYPSNQLITFQSRKIPTDSYYLIHEITNQISQQEFGIGIRNLMFGIMNEEGAAQYGPTYAIFPIGTYSLYYSTMINDFFTELGSDDRINASFEASEYDLYDNLSVKYKELFKDYSFTGDIENSLSNFIKEKDLDGGQINLLIEMIDFDLVKSIGENKQSKKQFVQNTYNVFISEYLDSNNDVNSIKSELKEFFKDIFEAIFNSLLEVIEQHVHSYLVDVNETMELEDILGSDVADEREIMIDCNEFFAMQHEQYMRFLKYIN